MALGNLPSSGSDNFESTIRATLHTWRDSIDTKAASSHSHGEGGTSVYFSTAANWVALSAGTTDGEMAVTADNGEVYVWSASSSEWRLRVVNPEYIPVEWGKGSDSAPTSVSFLSSTTREAAVRDFDEDTKQDLWFELDAPLGATGSIRFKPKVYLSQATVFSSSCSFVFSMGGICTASGSTLEKSAGYIASGNTQAVTFSGGGEAQYTLIKGDWSGSVTIPNLVTSTDRRTVWVNIVREIAHSGTTFESDVGLSGFDLEWGARG